MPVQGKVPMFGSSLHRRFAAERAMGIDQHFRAEGTAAILALIAVSARIAADGTSAHNIPVGQKGLSLLIIILFGLLHFQLTPAVQRGKELLCGLMMYRFTGPVVDIERNSQVGKVLFDQLMILVDNGPWCSAFLHGLDRDSRSVLVTSANEGNIPLLSPQVTHINICRQISARQVANVLQSVRIGQRCRNQVSFWSTHHSKLVANLRPSQQSGKAKSAGAHEAGRAHSCKVNSTIA